jgi:small ligand-binding sensory domain FIST
MNESNQSIKMEATTSASSVVAKEEEEETEILSSPEIIKDDREDKKLVLHSLTTGVSWSEVLATPSDGDQYSPARDMGDKECLHGAGRYILL